MSALWSALIVVLLVCVATLSVGYVLLSQRVVAVLSRMEAWLVTPHLRPPGLGAGARVHSFTAVRQDGVTVNEQILLGHPSVVLFVKADCAICRKLSRRLTRRRLDDLTLGGPVYVVVRNEQERDALALDPGLHILFQEDGTVSWAFRSTATPQAFLIDADGIVVAVGFPNSLRDLKQLVTGAPGEPRASAQITAH